MNPAEQHLEQILACLPDDPSAFRATCSKVENWSALIALAARHGLSGVIERAASANGVPISPEIGRRLRRQLAVQSLLSERLARGLAEAARIFAGAGIRAVALKGTVLAQRLYSPPSLRASSDIDLLVAPKDLFRTHALLERIGYAGQSGPGARYFREHHHHVHLHRPDGVHLELHFRALSGFGTILPADVLLERARPYTLQTGESTWILCPEDELLYLCAHVGGHAFLRLGWLFDLKLFLTRYPDVNHEIVRHRARAFGLESVLSYTLHLLRERFRANVPPDDGFLAATRLRFADQLRKFVGDSAERPMALQVGTLALMAALCDRPRLAAAYLQHHLSRVARRRAYRHFPKLAPQEWSA